MFYVRDREAGNVICPCNTLAEAKLLVIGYEIEDKLDGTYTPDFYEIVDDKGETIE